MKMFYGWIGIALLFGSSGFAETVLVHAGTLLTVPGRAPLDERTVVVRDGKIADIRAGFVRSLEGEDVTVIDLSDQFVMPGFIDLHVHLTGQSGDGSGAAFVRQTDAHAALRAAMYAERTLMAGFTTVRNLGSRGDAMFALRDAIAAGHVPGPKILVAGYSITPSRPRANTESHHRVARFQMAHSLDTVARRARERGSAMITKAQITRRASDEGLPARTVERDRLRAG